MAISTGGPEVEEFLNILPPGQDGMVTENELDTFCRSGEVYPNCTGPIPPHYADQMHMYESLVFDTSVNPDRELLEYYKDAPINLPSGEAVRSYSPVNNVTIRRDRFGVPYIEGQTRYATMYGIGYATAEDRLFLMDVLRHLGRAKLGNFLPAIGPVVDMDRDQLRVAPYRESDLTQQVRRGCNGNREQRQVCRDARAFIDGVNAFINDARANPGRNKPAFYQTLGAPLENFVMEDVVAISSLVTGIFGTGGANELGNGLFLSRLKQHYPDTEARKIWRDFNPKNDPESVTTIQTAFPYNDFSSIDPSSTALLDPGSVTNQLQPLSSMTTTTTSTSGSGAQGALQQSDVSGTPQQQLVSPEARRLIHRITSGLGALYERNLSMSNALVIGAEHMQSDHPVAVFGPQTSYFVPQLLMEMAVDGPRIRARGVAFAGVNMYVQLGRGTDYAWSATSSGADISDQWVLELCEPNGDTPTVDSTHYLYQGQCRSMETFNHVTGGDTFEIQLTVHGFVTHRGTVDSDPVAVTKQRTTFNRETESALGFKRLNNPNFMSNGASSFRRAVDGIEATFNWFYVDSSDIAYQHSCRCPLRDLRSNPELPTWGKGRWDWTGRFLDQSNNPHAVNPPQGYLVNWNNKPAPEFSPGGASVHRSQLLEDPLLDRIANSAPLTRTDAVEIMIDGGTRDLKGQDLYRLLLDILGSSPPAGSDPRVKPMRDRLQAWVDSGGHRRDVNPVDAPVDTDPLTPDTAPTYDHGVAVQIADAAFEPLVRATFGDTIADLLGTGEDSPRGGQGSAFQSGPYGHLHKDWRQVLARSVSSPNHRTYCGGGDLATCRQQLWDALDQTASDLESQFGSSSVADWDYDAERDNLTQLPLEIIPLPNMQWVNRPTFQQVAQPGGTAVGGSEESTTGSTGGGDGGACLVERVSDDRLLLESLRDVRDRLMNASVGRWLTVQYYRGSRFVRSR